MLKSDLRFESIIFYNINLPGSTFYFFQLSQLYIMGKRIGRNRLRIRHSRGRKENFDESGVGDIVVNSRILNVFKNWKISGLQTAYRRESKAGGKSQAKLLSGWKTGPKYLLKIYYNEVEVQNVKTQCGIPRGQIKNHSHASHLYLR